MTLKSIIQHLQGIVKELDLATNDSVILEQGVKIYISSKISQDKKENIKEMKENRDILKPVKQTKSNEPEPISQEIKATDKQIDFLIKLGFSGNIDNLSKKDAIQIIKELKENRRFKQ